MLRPALLALTLALTAAAHADEAAAPSAAPSLLNRLAALAGTWTGVSTGHGGEPTPVTVSYRVTSAGKAVTETFMEGTPHEMLTVFHLDGDRLVLTHYCGLGNQPHMRADEVTPEQIRFTCTGGANIHEGQTTHMHGLTLEWKDADHLTATWTLHAGEAGPGPAVKSELTRQATTQPGPGAPHQH